MRHNMRNLKPSNRQSILRTGRSAFRLAIRVRSASARNNTN